VPAGAVHQHDAVGAGADGLAELVEHRLHGGGAHRGQDQCDPGIALGTDGAEPIGRLVAQVAHAARAHALLEPAAAEAAGRADPGLVQEPDLEPPGLGMAAGDLGDHRRNFFKCLLGLAISCGVHGPRLLPQQAEIVEQPQHAVLGVADAKRVATIRQRSLTRRVLRPSRSGSGPRAPGL
jgi:hypothetical protein